MSNGWIELDRVTGLVRQSVKTITDLVQLDLKNLKNLDVKSITELKKRKLINEVIVKYFIISKGPQFVLKLDKLETDLTMDMLVNDHWQTLTFKDYNFDAKGYELDYGALHPLLKVKSEFRQIFLEMGFSEMATNNFVEAAFWNFDALFVPQNHPARDIQDTFYLSNPSTTRTIPKDYMRLIKRVHSYGNYGSKGYVCFFFEKCFQTDTNFVKFSNKVQLSVEGI